MLNLNPANSLGTQVNRALDNLGLADSFGDKIGALVDLQRGDIAGAMRNLFDLSSGLKTSTLDNLTGSRSNPAFGCGFVPRHTCGGSHLERYRSTYFTRDRVGNQAHVGQKYNFGWGPFQCQGRITSRQYNGSFCKPIRLADNEWLYRGRTYPSLNAIYRDARDGRTDGVATTAHTVDRWRVVPNSPFANFPATVLSQLQNAAQAGVAGAVGAGVNAANSLRDVLGSILGGVAAYNPAAGASPSQGGAPSNGSSSTDSVLNGGGTLEEKIALLMNKLSSHFDQQIQDKMKEVEQAMAADKKKTEGGGGGLFGGAFKAIAGVFGAVAPIAGKIAGTAIGGPLGGFAGGVIGDMAGNVVNNMANGSAGGEGGASGDSTGKSNLQLLQTQLQQLIDRRNQMFQTVSQMLKSLGDTSNSIIRNLKA